MEKVVALLCVFGLGMCFTLLGSISVKLMPRLKIHQGKFGTLISSFMVMCLVASLIMRRGTQIGSMTLLALVLFALGGFLRGYFRGAPAAEATYGDRAVWQLESSWSHFMNLQAGTLLAYFIAFMFLILILFGVRTVFGRS